MCFTQVSSKLTNVRLDWKALPDKNTLALYKHLYITEVKSFITLGFGQQRKYRLDSGNAIRLFNFILGLVS
jgi:hypothetical protein